MPRIRSARLSAPACSRLMRFANWASFRSRVTGLMRDDRHVADLQALRRSDENRRIEFRQFSDRRGREVFTVFRPVAMEQLHPLLKSLPFGIRQVGVEHR